MSPPGRISSAMPTKPTTTPTIASGLSRLPFAAKSKVAIHSGKVATMSAATPVSIRCCDDRHEGVSPDEQERADDRRRDPVVESRPRAARAEDREEDRPRDEEADRGHQERRDRLDRDLHPEVRRTPDDVDRAERGPDRCGRCA